MKTKIIIIMLFIILFTVFVSQNTKIIDLNFLVWQIELSTIVVISITFLAGMIAGFLLISIFTVKEKKKKEIKSGSETNEIIGKEN